MLISAIVILLLGELLLFGAPFFGFKKSNLPAIVSALKVKKGSVCYGLGYGNAKILRHMRKHFEDMHLIGIESGILPTLLARLLSIGKGVKIMYKSIFYTDLSKATHIYLCAGRRAMKRLEEKITKECNSGTRIVSLDFQFPNLTPVEHITIDDQKILAKNIYVYELKK